MSEERITSHTGGAKGQKTARFDLIPAGPLWQLAEVYGHGAKKYELRNWERGYDWSLAFGALQRHAWAFWNGEDIDPEDGKPHMAAVAFHAFSLLEFMERHRDFDDRPNAEMRAFPIIEVPGMTGPGIIGDFSFLTTAPKEGRPFSRVLREGGSPEPGSAEAYERALDDLEPFEEFS